MSDIADFEGNSLDCAHNSWYTTDTQLARPVTPLMPYTSSVPDSANIASECLRHRWYGISDTADTQSGDVSHAADPR